MTPVTLNYSRDSYSDTSIRLSWTHRDWNRICFLTPALPKRLISWDDRLPKLGPIKKKKKPTCESMWLFVYKSCRKTDLTLACPLPRCAGSAPESFLRSDAVSLHDLLWLHTNKYTPAHEYCLSGTDLDHSVCRIAWGSFFSSRCGNVPARHFLNHFVEDFLQGNCRCTNCCYDKVEHRPVSPYGHF